MSKQLVIIGNGGHTQDILSIIESTQRWGSADDVWLLDDVGSKNRLLRGSGITNGSNVYDTYLKLMSVYGKDLVYIIGVNSSFERRKIAQEMGALRAVPSDPIVHATASIAASSKAGVGCVLGPFAALTANVIIGDHVHMNTGSSVNQGSKVGHYSTLSPGARVCGDVIMGHTVSMGASSTIINLKNIGSDVTIGAGAVVIEDIPDSITVVGVPAKPLVK